MTTFRHYLGSAFSLLWGLKGSDPQHRSLVLMYHSIGGRADGDHRGLYSVRPSMFRRQVSHLCDRRDSGLAAISTFDDVRPGTISVTFDDGYADNLTVAAPILAESGIPFHVFLCPAFIESGDPAFLNRGQVCELASIPGVSLGVHGYSHRPLTRMNTNELEAELVCSRKWLEDLVQKPVTSMSYPHGAVNRDVAAMVSKMGFQLAASSKFGPVLATTNHLNIPRIDIWSLDTCNSFQSKLDGNWDWMKWRS